MKTSSKKTGPSTGVKLPRGLRNNNPLNIRKGCSWIGLRDFPTDKEFCEFKTMAYGYRAAFITLRTYYSKHNCRTLREIINRWAPPSENDTEKYLDIVLMKTGIRDADRCLPHPRFAQNKGLWKDIILAMAEVENGTQNVSPSECEAGMLKVDFI